MSSETRALIEVSFPHQTFNSKSDVVDYIEERESLIAWLKNKLFSLAMITEPKKFCDSDIDPIGYIQTEFDEAWESLETAQVELCKAQMLLDSWDEATHDDTPIYDPMMYGRLGKFQRIEGDFVKMIFKDKIFDAHTTTFVKDEQWEPAMEKSKAEFEKAFDTAVEIREIEVQAREPEFYKFCKENNLDVLSYDSKKAWWTSQDMGNI